MSSILAHVGSPWWNALFTEVETPFRNFEIRRWRFLQTQCRLYVLSFVRSFLDQASPTKHQQFLRCLDILHVSTTVLACSDDPDWDLPWFIECVFTPRDVFALVRSLWCNWEKLSALIFSGTSASIKNVNTKSLSNFNQNRTARTSILFFLDPPP